MSGLCDAPRANNTTGTTGVTDATGDIATRLAADTAGLLTIRDWTRYAASAFTRAHLAFGQGSASAVEDAVWLVTHALALPRDGLDRFFDARITAAERDALLAVLRRRIEDREPAAYITGEAWLGDFSFRADRRAIIPRSYFLEVIPDQINPWLADPENIRAAADICTGGGSLAILLANAYPNAVIDAVDISPDALALASENIADYGLQDTVRLWLGDLLEPPAPFPPDAGAGTRFPPPVPLPDYNIIVCNPPYEPERFLETLPAEFRHEPPNALVSGADGMDILRRLLPQAAARLAAGGVFLAEAGGLRAAIEQEFPALEINWLPTADGSDCVFLARQAELSAHFL